MQADRQEAEVPWAALGDAEQRGGRRSVLKGLAVLGLLMGCAALAVQLRVQAGGGPSELLSSPQSGNKELETVISPALLARATSVQLFNDLLTSSIVRDAQALYETMPREQVVALFGDFLAKGGKVAPQVDKARFAVFQQNVLTIMQHNADAYQKDPEVGRARFGITVHADWSWEEFETTRLNLKATNISAYESLLKAHPKEKQRASGRPPMTNVALDESAAPTQLAGNPYGEQCNVLTGGTCLIFPCKSARGASCYEGTCICTDEACPHDGKCVRPGNCDVSTGGTCHVFGCRSYRHAQCVEGHCVCPLGQCAKNGVCVTDDNYWSGDWEQITCSQVLDSAVRDQGTCGDCWAFSTAEQLHYMTVKKYGADENPGKLSVQYLVDCLPAEYGGGEGKKCKEGVKGCCGGLPFQADRWLEQSGGVPTMEAYGSPESGDHPFTPYECKQDVEKKVRPTGSIWQLKSELLVANTFCDQGPISIAIAANSALQHYIGGVMTVDQCPAAGINHAVIYSGIDKTFDDGRPVHVVLNSWGSWWGVSAHPPYRHVPGGTNGHVLFKYGQNVGNMVALATVPDDVELL